MAPIWAAASEALARPQLLRRLEQRREEWGALTRLNVLLGARRIC